NLSFLSIFEPRRHAEMNLRLARFFFQAANIATVLRRPCSPAWFTTPYCIRLKLRSISRMAHWRKQLRDCFESSSRRILFRNRPNLAVLNPPTYRLQQVVVLPPAVLS